MVVFSRVKVWLVYLPSLPEIAHVRYQRLRLQFGLIRVGSVMCSYGSAVEQLWMGCILPWY